MNNKNKNLIIIILCVVVLLLAISIGSISYIKSLKDNSNSNNTFKEENHEVSEEELIQDAINVAYNNYLLTYLMEADINTSEESIKDKDNNTYYLVNDSTFPNITSLNDLDTIIDNTFTKDTNNNVKSFLKSEHSNKYLVQNGKFYVKKSLETCNVNNGIEVKKENFNAELIDTNAHVYYQDLENKMIYTYQFPIDNNKVKSSILLYNCNPNFSQN